MVKEEFCFSQYCFSASTVLLTSNLLLYKRQFCVHTNIT